ncbi:MAG TPA: ABC transporter substrate-binding protein/permease [Pirellulales bacterium]|nr:ABC transporter substrate-binding protein/permease [Pirellulales bacterium]
MILRLILSIVAGLIGAFPIAAGSARADTLADVRARGHLIWGGDAEGGGPYVYPNPAAPRTVVGFEVDLAQALAAEIGVTAQFFQAPWDDLPSLLETGQIDVILNGYELTPARTARMASTSPYYVYRLALLVPYEGSQIEDWERLHHPRPGRPWRVGTLVSSGAYLYLRQHYDGDVELIGYKANTDAMREVETGKLDATVVDLPMVTFFEDQYPGLRQVGVPAIGGYYVAYVRQRDRSLRDALDTALARLLADGRLRQIYERYGLWNDDQLQLAALGGKTPLELGVRATRLSGWQVLVERGPILVRAAGMTVLLACLSMPLAIGLGILIALGRLYGPAALAWLLTLYVEIIRGTPLLLQLYVIFYLLPQIGVSLRPIYAAVLGLAINYSAYEAEIYRAGILAIPRGQMEAALALGMSTSQAVRRIILPQAIRLVIPPVTNDFIALFKDTSVCSVITVMELTGAYSVQRNDTLATGELAALTALLYLAMSVPLAYLARWFERRQHRRPAASSSH